MAFDQAQAADGRAPTLIIGHRGAAGLRPENTLPSFAHAVELGVQAVELDVHVVEGELVVIHDDSLERTTDGSGRVADCSLAELKRLDAGAGAAVPLLREVFELLPATVGINVELKGAGAAAALAEFLRQHGKRDLLVSSFDHDALCDFHSACMDVPVAPLFGRWRGNVWQVAQDLGAWSINLSLRIATGQRIAEAHRRGYRVLVYTVNDVDVAHQLVESGVDGIFTDHPERVTLGSLGDSTPG
jgi:glycerophosphoryl diester phosphodiesterase